MSKDNRNGQNPGQDLPDADDALLAEGPTDFADFAATPDIEAIIAERDDYRDRFMRALADAENARKRADRERRDAEQYGGTRLARDLAPVHDNLTRALAHATDEHRAVAGALIEGVELTLRELESIFAKHGVTVINPPLGTKFDPQVHEAMFEAPVPGTVAGTIIQVMDNGFMLHDRLLRPAKVGVSSNPGN